MQGWIGVDLDGTLAHYESKQFPFIGRPLMPMLERVKQWRREGKEVRILTARVAGRPEGEAHEQAMLITNWLIQHLGEPLPITCRKDYDMIELWDDRAVRVIHNTGERCCGE